MFTEKQLIVARCKDFPTWDEIYKLQKILAIPSDEEKPFEYGFWRPLEKWEYENFNILYSESAKELQKSDYPDQSSEEVMRKIITALGYRYNDKGELFKKESGLCLYTNLFENGEYEGSDDEDNLERYKFSWGTIHKMFFENEIAAFVLPNGYPITDVYEWHGASVIHDWLAVPTGEKFYIINR